MRILYASVHQILEFDELRLFQDLGHEVFSVGAYHEGGPGDVFRLAIDMGPSNAELRHKFLSLGCKIVGGSSVLTRDFVALFDIVVVMHDIGFILRQWPALSERPVVLRTIGQGIDVVDPLAAELRPHGLHIVRYSPNEMLSDSYIGGGDVIRFYKRPDEYGPWTGGDGRVLTFVNDYQARFPKDFDLYTSIVEGLHPALGGRGNETFYGAIGLVSTEEQRTLLSRCAAYLCCSTRDIPYTLSFIEAWMSGIPVVVMDLGFYRHRYFELPGLIQHGVTGFVCSNVADMRATIARLQADQSFGSTIGQAGREAAIRLFGFENIAEQWRDFFEKAVASTSRPRSL